MQQRGFFQDAYNQMNRALNGALDGGDTNGRQTGYQHMGGQTGYQRYNPQAVPMYGSLINPNVTILDANEAERKFLLVEWKPNMEVTTTTSIHLMPPYTNSGIVRFLVDGLYFQASVASLPPVIGSCTSMTLEAKSLIETLRREMETLYVEVRLNGERPYLELAEGVTESDSICTFNIDCTPSNPQHQYGLPVIQVHPGVVLNDVTIGVNLRNRLNDTNQTNNVICKVVKIVV